MQKLTEIIRMRVSPQIYKKVAQAAADSRRTVSDWARLAVEAALKDGKKG